MLSMASILVAVSVLAAHGTYSIAEEEAPRRYLKQYASSKTAVIRLQIEVVGTEKRRRRKHINQNIHRKERETFSGRMKNGVRVIKVDAFRYGFSPNPIVVKKDEKVRLEITSTDATHGFVIKELGIGSIVAAGRTESVEFISEETGDFHVECTINCEPGTERMGAILRVI